MMKKNQKRNITTLICFVLLAGILFYFYFQLNKTEKLAIKIQETAVTDSGTISSIVNFFNASLAPQQ